MNDSQEMLVVCMALLGGDVALTLLLFLLAPCLNQRGRIFGVVLFVILGLTLISSALNFYWLVPLPVFIYLNFTIFAYWGSFIRPATRPLIMRLLISWPTSIYQASCMLLLPLSWVSYRFWQWFPLVVVGLSVIGFLQSTVLVKEYVYFSLKDPTTNTGLLSRQQGKPKRERFTVKRSPMELPDGQRVLRIAQITDPHLGSFMSKERLNEISTTIRDWNPDLVFLTGDFMTIESHEEPDKLSYGFAPLKDMRGKVFACFGNHDYEAPETAEEALRDNDIVLLKDQRTLVDTPVGKFEIIGTEFTFAREEGKRQHMQEVARLFPKGEYPRIHLVHNPEEFTYIPDGTADLVLSGHTHGGQLGLFSLGLNVTMYGLVKRSPDNGLWRQGDNLLYVHRGTGFYGFPLRMGVSGELSLMTVTM